MTRVPDPQRGRVWPLDIVVVDDDVTTGRVLGHALTAMGHACRVVASAKAALLAMSERRADVLVCDWEMPAMSGLELCRRTRASSDDGHYVYLILVTGHGDRGRVKIAMEAGADDFQQKPIDLDELEARLVLASRIVALHRRLADQAATLRRDSQRLYVASHTDALTGVRNRLALEEELEPFRAERMRYGRRASLAMCDIDLFKHYNDAFGHIAGDEALRKIAQTIKSELRASDRVYRYGGEEFLVVLPEQGRDEAARAMERVLRAVEGLGIASYAPGRVLTASAGVAELDAGDDGALAWVRRADEALYRAKKEGRNRVVALSPGLHASGDVTPSHGPS